MVCRSSASCMRGNSASPPPSAIGVYPETKHPTYFQNLGLPMEELLVKTLHHHGYKGRDGLAIIQCFEVANLKQMRRMTELPIVQLMEAEGGPFDFVAKGVKRTYHEMTTPSGLAEVATYATAIGPHKLQVIPLQPDGTLDAPSSLLPDAHAAGLKIHAYTFRAENQFLPEGVSFRRRPASPGRFDGRVAGVPGSRARRFLH